jgi:hypothetical protein
MDWSPSHKEQQPDLSVRLLLLCQAWLTIALVRLAM